MKTKKKVVLHLLWSNQYSGAENVVCQIMEMFAGQDSYEMIYCSPDGPIRQALAERGLRYEPLENLSVHSIRKVMRKVKPDIIHAHDMGISFLAALACGKTPLVSHIHNNNFESRKVSVRTLGYYLAAQKAKKILWVSHSAQEGYYFHAAFEQKSQVLYNVIDAQKLLQKAAVANNTAVYDILYLGRLTYPKDPHRMVEVLAKVMEQIPNARAAIVGSGDMEAEIRQSISEKGLSDRIDCLGFLSNPYGILQHAKVMLMTSRWEGTPMCALEAIALGVPIVSTPTDGLRELVVPGKTGFLADSEDKLAQACCDILQEDALRQQLKQNSLRRAEELLDVKHYRSTLQNLYESI